MYVHADKGQVNVDLRHEHEEKFDLNDYDLGACVNISEISLPKCISE